MAAKLGLLQRLGQPFRAAPLPTSGSYGRSGRILSRWLLFLALPPIAGIGALAAYADAVAGLSSFAVGLLTAAASLVVGAVLGFLFGIPRSNSGASAKAEGWFKSSTSLEEISDWLTKILVGLSLVELGKLEHSISRLVAFLGPSLAPARDQNAVTLGILTLYGVSGFIIFYLGTRVYVAPAFAAVEEQLRNREAEVEAAASSLKESPLLQR
jgi:hypothetical protein